MAKKRHSDNGSTAVMDPPEQEPIAATLEDAGPVQGPILEPEAIAVYEHEHYQEIRERNEAVRQLELIHDSAKLAAKRAKDNLDDAQSALTEFISRGADIPGRKFARKVRLLKDVQADSELGKDFITLTKGQEFDVHDIEGDTVAILVQGIENFLELGEFEVIEWSDKAPKPEALPKKPKRIRMLVTVGNDDLGFTAPDAELDPIVDAEGDVSILLGGQEYPLEAEEFEVIEWSTPVDPNGWRIVPLAEVLTNGNAKKAIKILEQEGITTFGKFVDWQAERNEFRNLQGVGPEMETAVGDDCANFWQKHPEWAEAANGQAS